MAESGIYEIVNLVNGKRYVGSSLNFRNRWNSHRRMLREGRHHSRHLQAAWKKYGAESFRFRIVERCGRDVLLGREQHHIDQGCEYNVCRKAGSPLGVKHTKEARRKMSERRKGIPKTPEQIAACAAGIRKSFQDPERLRRHSDCVRASYTDDLRKLRSEQSRARWSDPAYRAKMSEKIRLTHDDDRRALTGKQAQARWSDPAYKRRMRQMLKDRGPPSEEVRRKISQSLMGNEFPVDEARRRAKLTDDQARSVLRLRTEGATYDEIASAFGVRVPLIGRICRRERYQWVHEE